jgi:hypothetical protein
MLASKLPAPMEVSMNNPFDFNNMDEQTLKHYIEIMEWQKAEWLDPDLEFQDDRYARLNPNSNDRIAICQASHMSIMPHQKS